MNSSLDAIGLLEHYNGDIAHANRVKNLSALLFDKINFVFDIGGKAERLLLENAALLHDIGYFRGEEDHNLHSYDLIVREGIQDFSANEVFIIANIARYHRGKKPDKEHPPFSKLDKVSRKMVKRLCSILRIADGLDGNFAIQDIKIEQDIDNNILYFTLVTDKSEVFGEISSAIRKKDLFERTFKKQVVFKFQN